VLRKGSEAELTSGVNRLAYQDMKIQSRSSEGGECDPMVSPELIVLINCPALIIPTAAMLRFAGFRPSAFRCDRE